MKKGWVGMAILASAVLFGLLTIGLRERPASPADCDPGTRAADADCPGAFDAMQHRGAAAMGVDQYTSTHQFEALPDGGRIALQRDAEDAAGTETIRSHLQDIANAFGDGDFRIPGFVHDGEVPGAAGMAARRAAIAYTYRALPRGGEVRITTTDTAALAAIHRFLAFQGAEHRTAAHR